LPPLRHANLDLAMSPCGVSSTATNVCDGAGSQFDGRDLTAATNAWFVEPPTGTFPSIGIASAAECNGPVANKNNTTGGPVVSSMVVSSSVKATNTTKAVGKEYMSRVVIIHMLPPKWDERQLRHALEDSGFVAGADFDLTMTEVGRSFALVHFRTQSCAKALCGLLCPLPSTWAPENSFWPAGVLAAPALPIAISTYKKILQETWNTRWMARGVREIGTPSRGGACLNAHSNTASSKKLQTAAG